MALSNFFLVLSPSKNYGFKVFYLGGFEQQQQKYFILTLLRAVTLVKGGAQLHPDRY